MCDATAMIGLALMAAGTGAKAYGEHKAGKKVKRAYREEQANQKRLRSRSLDAAEGVIQEHDPRQMQADIEAPVAAAQAEGDRSQQLATAFADPSAPAATGEYVKAALGASRDARRSGVNQARIGGMSDMLSRRLNLLRGLAHEQGMINEDSRRGLEALPYRVARAGRSGAGMRLVGGVASGVGQGLASQAAWAPDENAGLNLGTFNADTGSGSRLLYRRT